MCYTPVIIKDKSGGGDYSHLKVPCGKCPKCLTANSNSWLFRLLEEKKQHIYHEFVTLTYQDEKLVYNDQKPILVKDHLSQFFRKMRRKKTDKIKFFACGEYGGQTNRPHYHAIIFGAHQEEILNHWEHGHVHFGDVTEASIRYVTNYVNKHKRIFTDVTPEFKLMSKGLGKSYITDEIKRYHEQGMKDYVTLRDGVKLPMPRYYKKMLFDEGTLRHLADKHRKEHGMREENQTEQEKLNTALTAFKRQDFKDNLKNKI